MGQEALGLDEAETAYSGDVGTLGQDVDGSGMSGFDSPLAVVLLTQSVVQCLQKRQKV